MATSRNSGAGTQEVHIRTDSEAARMDTSTVSEQSATKRIVRRKRSHNPKAKKVRTAPPGVYIPDRGWPKYRYVLNCFFNHANLVPDITRGQWRDEKFKEIKSRADEGVRLVIISPFFKSSIKTRTNTNLAGILAQAGLSVLVMPATQNTSTASLGEMSGFEDGEVMTLDELVLNRYRFRRGLAFNAANKRYTADGFMVVSEGVNDARQEKVAWTVDDWIETVRIMRPHFDIIILDPGNDDILKDSIGLAGVHLSDLIYLPHNGSDKFSTKRLKKTFDAIKVDPYQGLAALDIVRQDLVHVEEDPSKLMFMSGELVPTWDKMRHAIVVSGRTTEKEWTLERVKEVLRAEIDPQSSHPYEWAGPHQVIGHDSYIASDGSICNTKKLDDLVFDQFLSLGVLVMNQGAEAMKRSNAAWENLRPQLELEREHKVQREQRLRPVGAMPEDAPQPPPDGSPGFLAMERSSS